MRYERKTRQWKLEDGSYAVTAADRKPVIRGHVYEAGYLVGRLLGRSSRGWRLRTANGPVRTAKTLSFHYGRTFRRSPDAIRAVRLVAYISRAQDDVRQSCWQRLYNAVRRLNRAGRYGQPTICAPGDVAAVDVGDTLVLYVPAECAVLCSSGSYAVAGLETRVETIDGRELVLTPGEVANETVCLPSGVSYERVGDVWRTVRALLPYSAPMTLPRVGSGDAVGIEIECYVDSITRAMDALDGLALCKRDGSVAGGLEAVSPPIQADHGHYEPWVRAVTDALGRNSATADEKCGLHVHVSQTLLSLAQVSRLKVALADFPTAVFGRAPNNYCAHPPHRAGRVSRYVRAQVYNRYQALSSYTKHGTHEFRQFSGRVDYASIMAAVEIALSLCAWARSNPAAWTFADYCRYLDVDGLANQIAAGALRRVTDRPGQHGREVVARALLDSRINACCAF